jgi:hypothetical protein
VHNAWAGTVFGMAHLQSHWRASWTSARKSRPRWFCKLPSAQDVETSTQRRIHRDRSSPLATNSCLVLSFDRMVILILSRI